MCPLLTCCRSSGLVLPVKALFGLHNRGVRNLVEYQVRPKGQRSLSSSTIDSPLIPENHIAFPSNVSVLETRHLEASRSALSRPTRKDGSCQTKKQGFAPGSQAHHVLWRSFVVRCFKYTKCLLGPRDHDSPPTKRLTSSCVCGSLE